MQHGIDVVENVVLGDGGLAAVMGGELLQRPIGDVVEAIATDVAITRDALRSSISVLQKTEIKSTIYNKSS